LNNEILCLNDLVVVSRGIVGNLYHGRSRHIERVKKNKNLIPEGNGFIIALSYPRGSVNKLLQVAENVVTTIRISVSR